MNNRGTELVRKGRYRQAAGAFRQSIEVSRGCDHPKVLATALDNLSMTAARLGQIDRGLAAHEEALEIFQALHDVSGQSTALTNLAALCTRAGRPDDAVAANRRAIEVSRLADDRPGEARAVSHLARVLATGGDLAGAIQSHRDAVAIWRDLGDREAEAEELRLLIARLAATRRYEAARGAADQAVAVFREVGRLADAAALEQWVESTRARGGRWPLERRGFTVEPRDATAPGCVPFLAALGAVAAFLLDGPWFVVAVLAPIAVIGWGTCLTSLVALPVGVIVIWKCWGTWWMVAGLALLAFVLTSARFRAYGPVPEPPFIISARLEPDETDGPE
ncbi:hypothetical protein GCM10022254_51810 [Actinomadura meridiana]|uniref:Tetratricopeptide repeat protein n=1 Tax=Actinomadura meridiana TaxID=559626 RepID=A0ABP8CDE4_9ACTN